MKKFISLLLLLLTVCVESRAGDEWLVPKPNITYPFHQSLYYQTTNLFLNTFYLGGTNGLTGYFIWNGQKFYSPADFTVAVSNSIAPSNLILRLEFNSYSNYVNNRFISLSNSIAPTQILYKSEFNVYSNSVAGTLISITNSLSKNNQAIASISNSLVFVPTNATIIYQNSSSNFISWSSNGKTWFFTVCLTNGEGYGFGGTNIINITNYVDSTASFNITNIYTNIFNTSIQLTNVVVTNINQNTAIITNYNNLNITNFNTTTVTNINSFTNHSTITVTNLNSFTNLNNIVVTNNNSFTNNSNLTITNFINNTFTNLNNITVTNNNSFTNQSTVIVTNLNSFTNLNNITVTNNNSFTNQSTIIVTNLNSFTNLNNITVTNNNSFTNNSSITVTNINNTTVTNIQGNIDITNIINNIITNNISITNQNPINITNIQGATVVTNIFIVTNIQGNIDITNVIGETIITNNFAPVNNQTNLTQINFYNPVAGGGGGGGDLTFEGVKIIGAGTNSGDGLGYSTIEIVPDSNLYAIANAGYAGQGGQYLIIDPTSPSHIHIRAGGPQDQAAAQLILGGEKANVNIRDQDNSYNEKHHVTINTRSTNDDYYAWVFNDDGNLLPPNISIQRGDIQSGTISGYVLGLGNGSSEAIITTPNGTGENVASQRLVINPGQGNGSGEGGDIYLWAGRGGTNAGSGGDVKIRGGYGPTNGGGGYLRFEGGDSADGIAGQIEIKGGDSTTSTGGYVIVQGGYGNSNADNGYVMIRTRNSIGSNQDWLFTTNGNILLPSGGLILNNDGSTYAGATGVNATNNVVIEDPNNVGNVITQQWIFINGIRTQ